MWEDKNSKITLPNNVTLITKNHSSLLLYIWTFSIMLPPNEADTMLTKRLVDCHLHYSTFPKSAAADMQWESQPQFSEPLHICFQHTSNWFLYSVMVHTRHCFQFMGSTYIEPEAFRLTNRMDWLHKMVAFIITLLLKLPLKFYFNQGVSLVSSVYFNNIQNNRPVVWLFKCKTNKNNNKNLQKQLKEKVSG